MKATLTVKFNLGDTIEDCFNEALRIALLLNLDIDFEFNKMTCICFANGKTSIGVSNYFKAIGLKQKLVFNI